MDILNKLSYPYKEQSENFHEYLEKEYATVYNNKDIDQLSNLIFYGKGGRGKLYQIYLLIKRYSPTELKYLRKMYIEELENFYIKISDIHFEIDMSTLGNSSRQYWCKIQQHIKNSMESTNLKRGIILCKNFHQINIDLLSTFRNTMMDNCVYIISTENVCFIPNNMLSNFKIINLKQIIKKKLHKYYKDVDVNNLKNKKYIRNVHDKEFLEDHYTNELLSYILTTKNVNYTTLREKIYNILIYQCNIDNVLWNIYKCYLENNNENGIEINTICNFSKLYHNNYRPIYHIERMIFEFFFK
jgi:hypothetical protein